MLKITNELLREYLEIEAVIKTNEKRLDEIKASLKEKGSTSTKDYVCTVLEQARTFLGGLKAFEDAGYKAAELESKGLLKHSVYKIVKVAEKLTFQEKSERSA